MKQHQYAVGDRVEKSCATCGENRGHVVSSLNKRGHISRVTCPQCGSRSPYKRVARAPGDGLAAPDGPLYDWSYTYRKGQTLTHPTFGPGEVTAVIEPQKIDVLFSDRVRRLAHARPRA